MNRLSDMLRSTADRAPLPGVRVSTHDVSRRVARSRGLRTGSKVLLGAGAIALIYAPIANAGSFATAGDESTGGLGAPSVDTADGRDALQYSPCGQTFDASGWPASGASVSARLDSDGPFEPGGTLPIAVSYAAPDGLVAYSTTAYVLWDGVVVGTASMPAGFSYEAAEVTADQFQQGVTLVNCFDGKPLPAADYTIVVVGQFGYPVVEPSPSDEPMPEPRVTDEPKPTPTVEPPVEPPVEPSVEPSVEPQPAPEPAPEPGTEPGSGGTDPVGTPDSSSGTSTGSTDIAVAPPVDNVVYAVSAPVSFTVAGEQAKEPFAAYLGGTEEGLLTPKVARALYQEGIAGAWNMANGSQRWVMTSAGPSDFGKEWQDSFFGCAWEGGPVTFPTESSEMTLLAVSASIPSSISVSYGWVVDGNPKVAMSVRNVSQFRISGYYGEPNPSLVLVRNGRVVAEAYPVSLNRVGDIRIMEDALKSSGNSGGGSTGSDGTVSSDSNTMIAPDYSGYLEPGQTLSGDYLWRDVNGCYGTDGPTDVTPGTYTVLSRQDVFVGGTSYGWPEPAPLVDPLGITGGGVDLPAVGSPEGLGSGSSDGSEGVASPDIAPAPAPDMMTDFVSFQVWTSLGTITVTR